jgi:carboxyl-terminal processing protease
MRTRSLAWFAGMILTSVVVHAGSSAENRDDAKSTTVAAVAHQAWAITDLVLDQDIDPPTRQQMLLQGIKALLRLGKKKTPAKLAERASNVMTREQFADLLCEAWPREKEWQDAGNTDQREHILFNGLLAWQSADGDRAFLSPQDVKRYEMNSGNRYVGTGIQIRTNEKEKLAQIMIPFPGGPARKAGARPGDLIVEVDGKSMEGLPLRKVVERLQGEDGTKVSMTVRQPGESTPRLLPMVRSVIPFSTVHGYRRIGEESWSFCVTPYPRFPYLGIYDLEAMGILVGRLGGGPAIGYLAIDEIKASTLSELRKIEPLMLGQGVTSLVLDLRFTTGEDLRHAALVADGLLNGGVFWRVSDCSGRIKKYKADPDCLFRGTPMVVLVGEQTGTLGAMVAAALQDHGRAITVGEMPKAELTVTSLVPLAEEGGALRLRTGRVERSGRAAFSEKQQLAAAAYRFWPDHVVPIEPKEMAAVLEWRQQQQSPEAKPGAKPPLDPQLKKAITLLRESLAHQNKEGQE